MFQAILTTNQCGFPANLTLLETLLYPDREQTNGLHVVCHSKV